MIQVKLTFVARNEARKEAQKERTPYSILDVHSYLLFFAQLCS